MPGLPPFPTGWYALDFSDELARGEVRHGRYFGRDLVYYRTASGEVAVVDAHCPHMGAHMGLGGTVEGEALRCPFHGFCFATDGRCVSTPYEGKKVPVARTGVVPSRDANGFVMAWHDELGRPPSWDVPTLPDDHGTLRRKTWHDLATHPQETTENSADLGHFNVVHGYGNVEVMTPLTTDGPYLTTRYAMTRANPILPFLPEIRTEFEVHVHGLGYSQVNVSVPQYGLRSRHFVMATPVDVGVMELRAALAIGEVDLGRVARPLGLIPKAWAKSVLERMALRAYLHDIQQDVPIWENKHYLTRPRLADGDGPIGKYRRWCRQFYPDSSANIA